jgi:hypothetical protein
MATRDQHLPTNVFKEYGIGAFENIGTGSGNPDVVINHQLRHSLAIDQDNLSLNPGHIFPSIFREGGGSD